MNHGAISVIYLALSAVCLIGLYGVYKPNINTAADNVFGHVERFTDQGFSHAKGTDSFFPKGAKVITVQPNSSKSWNGIGYKYDSQGDVEITGGTPKTKGLAAWYTRRPPQITNATQIHFNSGSMSQVRDMENMFLDCYKLKSVTATGNPGTSRVKDMGSMFEGDTSLSDVNALGNWDTSSVKNMTDMFSEDSSLSNVNALGNWDTSSVKNMTDMFEGDTSLSDVSALNNWNTSKAKATGMISMFRGDSKINKSSLNSTNFNTGHSDWNIF